MNHRLPKMPFKFSTSALPADFSVISAISLTLIQPVEVISSGSEYYGNFFGVVLEMNGKSSSAYTTYNPATPTVIGNRTLEGFQAINTFTQTMLWGAKIITNGSVTSTVDSGEFDGYLSSSKNAGNAAEVSVYGVVILCLMFLGLL